MISREYYQQTRTCGAQTPKLLDLKYCAHNFILKQNVKLESHCSQLWESKTRAFEQFTRYLPSYLTAGP